MAFQWSLPKDKERLDDVPGNFFSTNFLWCGYYVIRSLPLIFHPGEIPKTVSLQKRWPNLIMLYMWIYYMRIYIFPNKGN